MARTFVAVWPPPAVLDALLALPRPDLPAVRWLPRELLHVTLRFLGDVAPSVAAQRLRAARLPSATGVLGPTTRQLGPHVVAPVHGLDELAAAVREATADLGRPDRARPFVGHVTLARSRGGGDTSGVAPVAVTGRFDVSHVAVVSSDTHPSGARYQTAASIPVG